MISDLLVNQFIKEPENISNKKVRKSYGILSGGLDLIINIVLSALKITAGSISGSIALVSDGMNNLADCGATIIHIVRVLLTAKPTDKVFPFGFGRMEYITSLFIRIAIFTTGVEMVSIAIEKSTNADTADCSIYNICILVASLVLKLWMSHFDLTIGTRLSAKPLLVRAKESAFSCAPTLIVLLVQLIDYFFGYDYDSFAGILVGIIIAFNGLQGIWNITMQLLGNNLDPALTKNIRAELEPEEQIHSVYNIVVHNYGTGRKYVSLNIELPISLSTVEIQKITERCQTALETKFKAHFSLQVELIDTENPELKKLSEKLVRVASVVNPMILIYKLRLKEGKILSATLMIPSNCEMTDKEINEFFFQEMEKVYPEYQLKLSLDRIS